MLQLWLFHPDSYFGKRTWPGDWRKKLSFSELEVEKILKKLKYSFLDDAYYVFPDDLDETFLTPGMSIEFVSQLLKSYVKSYVNDPQPQQYVEGFRKAGKL